MADVTHSSSATPSRKPDLLAAIQQGRAEEIQRQVRRGLDINANLFTPEGLRLPLHVAVEAGNAESVTLLLSLGANAALESRIPGHGRVTPVKYARKSIGARGMREVVEAFEKHEVSERREESELEELTAASVRHEETLAIALQHLEASAITSASTMPEDFENVVGSVQKMLTDLIECRKRQERLWGVEREILRKQQRLEEHRALSGILDDSLQCVVCLEVPCAGMRIFLCKRCSNTLCHGCLIRLMSQVAPLHKCPTCRLCFWIAPPARNRAAEQLVEKVVARMTRPLQLADS